MQIRLTDITRKIVAARTESCIRGTNIIIVNQLSTLQPGTYLLQVITSDDKQQQKLVKMK